MKRIFDVCIASFLLCVLSPLILLIALLVRYKLGTPILFRQRRPGLYAKSFLLYKFRTMTDARDDSGRLLPDHIRLTPFGRFLRQYSLDELPQLWNVMKGDLSLVGPRPLLMEYLELYTERQAKRHHVRPGMTGWAQVNGRNALTWEERFELDVWYVEHRSFVLDLIILGRTIGKVMRSEGVSHSSKHVTMSKFTGSNST